MLDGIMIVWFVLTALSLLFAIYDLSTNTPVSWVQKLAWILVIAYTGPFGLFVFLLACRNPGKGLHATFTRANWKQGVNSEMHCLAGDATGIILCAIILSFFSLTPGVDLILEYVSAWIIGLFIFQALMMLDMFGIALAALGMLSTLATCLTIDVYGPICEHIHIRAGISPHIFFV